MHQASNWLPIYVQHILVGKWRSRQLAKLLSEAEQDIEIRYLSRILEENQWRAMYLCRTYLLAIARLHDEMELEFYNLRRAVEKLREFLQKPCPVLARHAQVHLNLAENAHARYLRERMDTLPRLHTFQMRMCA